MGCLIPILGFVFIFTIIWGFTVSPFLGIILLVGIFGGMIFLIKIVDKNELEVQNDKIKKLNDLQSQINDLNISQKFQSHDFQSSILLDEEQKKVCFIFANDDSIEIYDYKDILESEILEDGTTITSTSRSSQLGGAIIGGVLAGGVGAVVGGLSGKKSSEQEITKIDLKVIVNNTKSPNKIINFLTVDPDINGKPDPIRRDSPQYKNALSSISHWHSLLSILIKQVDLIDSENPSVILSIADEIKKLSDLYNQGILSEEEFNTQKQKLLSN
jgi:hypothetical protein